MNIPFVSELIGKLEVVVEAEGVSAAVYWLMREAKVFNARCKTPLSDVELNTWVNNTVQLVTGDVFKFVESELPVSTLES